MAVTVEVVLPRRVIPQPTPALNPGGDCAACVFGGLLGIETVQEVHERYPDADLRNRPGFNEALLEAQSRGELDRVVSAVPSWPVWDVQQAFGSPAHRQSLEWWAYLRMAMDAGYYGCANVVHGRTGPLDDPDHKVLFCGVRERREAHPAVKGAYRIFQEVLVSCSSTTTPDEEWVEVNELLQRRGGFNVVLARPVEG